jgi:phosphinothricin acetyltransferase
MNTIVRPAAEDDLVRINEIYNSYIVDRHVSFDTEPWTLEDREQWFARHREPGPHQALVVQVDSRVLGFASSGPFRSKAAYDTSVETTVVLDELETGKGLGGLLLKALLKSLSAAAVHRAYALIALPNDASVALHSRLGYLSVGVLDGVGHKLGEYHSVQIMEFRF